MVVSLMSWKNVTVNNAIASSRPVNKMIYIKLLLKGNYLESINWNRTLKTIMHALLIEKRLLTETKTSNNSSITLREKMKIMH